MTAIEDLPPALAFEVATALEIHRQWLKLGGKAVPFGLAELRDEYLKTARSRTAPQERDDLAAAFDAVHMAPKLLTIPQAAVMLAVSDRKVEQHIAAGELTAVRMGATVRVRVTDLDAFIASLPVRNPSQVSSTALKDGGAVEDTAEGAA